MNLREHIWLAVIANQALNEIIPYFKSLYKENQEFKKNLLKAQNIIKDDNVQLGKMLLELPSLQPPKDLK